MSQDAGRNIVLRDVYLVTHVFSASANDSEKRKLRSHGFPGFASHYSVITQDHIFHITSDLAQQKSLYFKHVARGQANLPLRPKFSNLLVDSPEDRRYRVLYCGRTPYRIPQVEFYAKFVMDFFDHYSITFSHCLNYAVTLAALIVNGETQEITDPFRNPPFVGTIRELVVQEDHRETL